MKSYLKKFFTTFSMVVLSLIFIIGGFIAYALTFPSITPQGQTSGGNFVTLFNKMLQSGDYKNSDGTVRYAQNSNMVDGYHAADLMGASSNIDCTSVFGSNLVIYAMCIGLGNGKVCTADSSTSAAYGYTKYTCYNSSGWDINSADAINCNSVNNASSTRLFCFNKNGRTCATSTNDFAGNTVYWTCKTANGTFNIN